MSPDKCTHWRVNFDGELWKCGACGVRFFPAENLKDAFYAGTESCSNEVGKEVDFKNWFYVEHEEGKINE